MYDIIIIGAGPAGMTAALYARRAEKTVLLIEKNSFGGQITHSPRVENYPGFLAMSGNEFAEKLLEQVTEHGADIELDEVNAIKPFDGGYSVATLSGSEFLAKSIIIATGSKHRTLGIAREEDFVGEGVSYCAVCDGAFYKGKTVAIIGGGNTALQEAVLLSDGCKKVYVVQNLDFLTGEGALQAAVAKRDNVEVILSSVVTELLGDSEITGIRIRNDKNGEESALTLDGIFVAIGQKPENEAFADIVELDSYGYISAGESCLPKTEHNGIFVAGDCRTKSIRQITTASADGAVAALSACRYVDSLKA